MPFTSAAIEHEPPAAPTPRRPSLLLRIAVTLVLLLLCLGATLFAAADRLFTREFAAVQQDRMIRQAADLKRLLDSDLRQVLGQAMLAATDSDLVHSTQYHLRLRGEAKAAQQDVARIADTLGLSLVTLLADGGAVVAEHVGVLPAGPSVPATPVQALDASARAVAVWHERTLWLLAEAAVQNEGVRLARLRVARPAAATVSAGAGELRVRLVGPAPAGVLTDTATVQRITEVVDSAGQPLHLELVMQDPSIAIVQQAKQTLMWVFATGCALAAAVMVWFLRRQILPLAELTHATAAVGRGDFHRRVSPRGAGEIAELAAAFNGMAADLGRLRGLERELKEQEKITAIGRLATRLAHDINNPLTVIKNAAMLMQRRSDIDRQMQDDLALIIHHSGRCATILENLVLFGRPLRLRSREIELVSFCHGVLERARLRHPDGQWRCELCEPGVTVMADPHQLEQVLENLLNNGYESAASEPVEMGCGLRNGRPYIQVRDRGAGFSPAAQGHLFELFYTTKKQGTGIGLANASAIARAHGGELIVENDCGAVVRIELPAAAIVRTG